MTTLELDCPDCGSCNIHKGEELKWHCDCCNFWWNVYEDDEE